MPTAKPADAPDDRPDDRSGDRRDDRSGEDLDALNKRIADEAAAQTTADKVNKPS